MEEHYGEVLSACDEGAGLLRDVGCGNGAFLRFATGGNSKLQLSVGIKNRAAVLAPPPDGGSGSLMVAGDGEQLSFPDDCFEVAVSVDALEWTPDLVAFLR